MVGRNNPCPCGSGIKYKKCCLPNDRAARAQRAEEDEALEIPDAQSPVYYAESEPVFNAVNASDSLPPAEVDPFLERADAFREYELTIEPELFSTVMEYRTGRQIPAWTIADFEFSV